MVLRYYHWVYTFLNKLQIRHPVMFKPMRGGSLGLNLAVLLMTAPVWAAAIVLYFVPLPSNLRYMLWTVLFFLAIGLAMYALYYVYWKHKR